MIDDHLVGEQAQAEICALTALDFRQLRWRSSRWFLDRVADRVLNLLLPNHDTFSVQKAVPCFLVSAVSPAKLDGFGQGAMVTKDLRFRVVGTVTLDRQGGYPA
jgi:hypothetical protein